ncbi:uncharacterized protein Pyn_21502 [Prunus yedoensis var. nudiflora]|uniref:Aminotransferase-like plant mobile domain-containing protein n=1 Tax=Prunus yedoensis var. nudiflora TaxID=2094558 RepID=A0A314U871_PRUYE|nr:uncharacterized protein Pyn_21502 [Prunus yedoensis var. nudiflora]
MASTNLPPIMLDHLYSVDENLKVGGPLLSLENSHENPIVGDEPSPETTPVIDPASISRCCIEKGLFPAVPLFFQYPCNISKSWSEWVDHELLDLATCNILGRAQVLDAIFLSKLWDIHIEAKMLRHVVRRWSTATHTFVCSWGEFTPTLEDVANISRLPICGNRSPFDIALTPEEIDKLAVLRRGAPTSPSTSLRFSNWIQYFGDANRQVPCRLAAFIALWLGRFVLCDFSPDCLHERVFPLALAIARGDAIPLAPMFLGHLYRLLDQTQLLEKNASGTMGVETFLNYGFLQVFLWEHFKGLDVHSLSHSYAIERADWGKGSYMPENLPLVCRWFKRMQQKGQDFLKLLDSIENFVFCPYGTSAETFTFVSFYVDVGDTVEVPAAVSQGGQFRRYALLNVAPIPLPTLGDSRSEIFVTYSPHRVKRQFGLDQGVPSTPNHDDPFMLHRIFWSNDHIPNSCRPLVLASKRRIGGFSPRYQAYWNRCLDSLREFQSFPRDRLPPTTTRLAGLVSEEKAIPLSQKRNLPFISKSGDIVGEFLKTRPKPGAQKPRSPEKSTTPVSSKWGREAKPSAKKEQTADKSKRFILKVAPSGPPRTREATPRERPHLRSLLHLRARVVPARCRKLPLFAMGTAPKRKRSDTPPVSPQVTPKHRSMCILHARFTGAHTSDGGASGARTVVTIDDDSDGGDTTETEASILGQEEIGDMHEDFNENDTYDRNEDAFAYSGDYPEGQSGSDTFHESAGSSMRRVNVEPVSNIAEGSHLAAAIVDPAQSTPEIGHVAQSTEIVPVVPSSSDPFIALVEVALGESPPTLTSTHSPGKARAFQVASPLQPVVQHFLRKGLEPVIPPAFSAALRSGTFVFNGAQPTPSHIQPLLRTSKSIPPASLPVVPSGDIAVRENTQIDGIATRDVSAAYPSSMSWAEWESSFTAFMSFFDSGVQVLRSADELLPIIIDSMVMQCSGELLFILRLLQPWRSFWINTEILWIWLVSRLPSHGAPPSGPLV